MHRVGMKGRLPGDGGGGAQAAADAARHGRPPARRDAPSRRRRSFVHAGIPSRRALQRRGSAEDADERSACAAARARLDGVDTSNRPPRSPKVPSRAGFRAADAPCGGRDAFPGLSTQWRECRALTSDTVAGAAPAFHRLPNSPCPARARHLRPTHGSTGPAPCHVAPERAPGGGRVRPECPASGGSRNRALRDGRQARPSKVRVNKL